MDPFALGVLARRLQTEWGGAWVQGVWEDLEHRLVLRLRRPGESAHLLFDPLGPRPGLGLVSARPPVPTRPPAAAALLRSRGPGRLGAVRQPPWERILRLEFADAGLVLMGEFLKHLGGLYLLDAEGTVRAALGGSRRRAELMGRPYAAPARPKGFHAPDEVTVADLEGWSAGGEALHRRVLGLSPVLGEEVATRAARDGWEAAYRGVLAEASASDRLWVCGETLQSIPCRGAAGSPDDDPLRVAGTHLLHAGVEAVGSAQAVAQRGLAKRRRRSLERRAEKIRADLDGLPDPELLRTEADSLAAELWRVAKGAREVEVPDLTVAGARLRLDLDPRVGPGENLSRRYERIKKLRRAQVMGEQRLRQTLDELAALDEAPLLPQTNPPSQQPSVTRTPFRRFRSSDGWSVWAGRNGRENDRLLREARPWDVWLHARDVPGAHVLIRKPGKEARVPEQTLREAAGLAAALSRGTQEGAVDVMVAEAGRVHKPKGASPGKVTVAGERTLRVRSEAASTLREPSADRDG